MQGIEVENLTKRFSSVTAVDHLSFKIKEGEVFGLLGPNGAGKTTTIRLLTSLISPTEGSAQVLGFDVVKEPLKVREVVGVLTENPSLYERLSAYENLDFFAEIYGIGKTERSKRIRELLEFFGLWERRNDKAGTFSKGMKQKLSIIRALVHQPPILFLDEPTSGLDPAAAKEIRELIERLSHKEKRTIVLSTHHLEDAEKLADRVMIINKGMQVALGSPDELRSKTSKNPGISVKLANPSRNMLEAVKNMKEVQDARLSGNAIMISLSNIEADTPNIVNKIVREGGKILSVTQIVPSLEDAYLKLVKEKN